MPSEELARLQQFEQAMKDELVEKGPITKAEVREHLSAPASSSDPIPDVVEDTV